MNDATRKKQSTRKRLTSFYQRTTNLGIFQVQRVESAVVGLGWLVSHFFAGPARTERRMRTTG
jgi:hypothetical protein